MTNNELIKISKEITKIYEIEVKDSLEIKKNEILDILKTKFSDYDKEYNLCYDNSVYSDMKVYSVIGRVKEVNSLYEKLHRKNLIFELIREFDITKLDDVKIKKDEIKTKIHDEYDDNIGCRIVCDLKEDVNNSLSLIKNKHMHFDDIKFLNLEDQPKTKKNGLDICKIDCEYNNIKFELQIKSKIESAWDDLEHDLYYKDHTLSIVKEINSKSLIHIGKLLKQLDEFMFDLREVNTGREDLNSKRNLVKLEQHFRDIIEPFTKDFTFNFSNISKELLFLLEDKFDNLGDSRHFEDKLNEINNNPQKRHDSWELIILEAIYNDICPRSSNPSFQEKYFNYICDTIEINDEFKPVFRTLYNCSFDNLLGSKHLLKITIYNELFTLLKLVKETAYEMYDESEEIINNALKIFGIKYMKIQDFIPILEEEDKIFIDILENITSQNINKVDIEKILKRLGE